MTSLTKENVLSLSAIQRFGMLIILILIIITFSFLSPHFFTYSNMMSMLRQIAVIGIIAAGQTLVIIKGGIDLSVGSIVAFAGVVSALVVSSTENAILGILAGLLAGAIVGVINGVFISKLKLSPLIVTLAAMTLYAGLALVISNVSDK
ncbi:ABC transporter permease [Virgibacillus doumboii]|uniref:ABC transporter permease n=1 Tax=Virgibacillus doumboii TaxID=2697503 RepID=UPI0013DEF6A5|nr:hypothetical protein [Virgibacillus doumboii]